LFAVSVYMWLSTIAVFVLSVCYIYFSGLIYSTAPRAISVLKERWPATEGRIAYFESEEDRRQYMREQDCIRG